MLKCTATDAFQLIKMHYTNIFQHNQNALHKCFQTYSNALHKLMFPNIFKCTAQINASQHFEMHYINSFK